MEALREREKFPAVSEISSSRSNEKIDKIADRLAGELAKRMFYEFVVFKYIPEIEQIKEGKIKVLRNERARKFLEIH